MSAGDQPGAAKTGCAAPCYDSSHLVRAEGVTVLPAFQATAATEYKTGTATVDVTDGRLTLDAIGGNNTKINWVKIKSAGPLAPDTTPPGAATGLLASPGNRTRRAVVDRSERRRRRGLPRLPRGRHDRRGRSEHQGEQQPGHRHVVRRLRAHQRHAVRLRRACGGQRRQRRPGLRRGHRDAVRRRQRRLRQGRLRQRRHHPGRPATCSTTASRSARAPARPRGQVCPTAGSAPTPPRPSPSWATDATATPRAPSANEPDARRASMVHMQYAGTTAGSVAVPGSWEMAVPNGLYSVKVDVGDAGTAVDSSHWINVENQNAIAAFTPAAGSKFATATRVVAVDRRTHHPQPGRRHQHQDHLRRHRERRAGRPSLQRGRAARQRHHRRGHQRLADGQQRAARWSGQPDHRGHRRAPHPRLRRRCRRRRGRDQRRRRHRQLPPGRDAAAEHALPLRRARDRRPTPPATSSCRSRRCSPPAPTPPTPAPCRPPSTRPTPARPRARRTPR